MLKVVKMSKIVVELQIFFTILVSQVACDHTLYAGGCDYYGTVATNKTIISRRKKIREFNWELKFDQEMLSI